MSERLYIVVLNWNGTDDTIACLQSIQRSTYDDFTTVVIDNGSSEQARRDLRDWCCSAFGEIAFYDETEARQGGNPKQESRLNGVPCAERLVFIQNEQNIGFAAGNNVGLAYALSLQAPLAMLLNNDTVVAPGAIGELVAFMGSHPDYVAVVPQIRCFEPNDRIWNCGGTITWYGNRRYSFAGATTSAVPQVGFERITFVTGCALLFRPKVAGVLTERFFFGEEDLEFSFRQREAKRPMACLYSSVIYHKVSASVGRMKPSTAGSIYLFYLSRLINNRQYSSPFMFGVKTLMHLGYVCPMAMWRYKLSVRQVTLIVVTLLRELGRIDRIDKQYWLKYLGDDFRPRLTPGK
jgi:GT2 family glycosyltransferase